jgi:hypothetical protein
MSNIVVTDSGCWEYTKRRDPKGYGRLHTSGYTLTHRIMWTIRYGDPGDLCVLHRCDNPPCCNPAHLFLGTVADNNRDMVAKKRHRSTTPTGEGSYRGKLTDDTARVIRSTYASGATQREIARAYGVSQSTVWRTIHGLTGYAS